MKPTALLGIVAALSLPLLASCADPDRGDDAEELRDRVAALPGVSTAEMDYTVPITLDSGKLQLRVEMAEGAEADQVVAVVSTTYEAFAGTHNGEEGDLDVMIGDDVVHLRSFEPQADVGAVEDAARAATDVLSSGSVRVDVNTQDVARSPHVSTTYAVSVTKPGRERVLRVLAELEEEHGDIPDARWSVQAGGELGWLVSSSQGFPGPEVLARFDDLSEGIPEGATVLLYDDYATLQLPAATSPGVASDVVGRHLRLLGGAGTALYDVESDYVLVLAITEGDCLFDTGALGARLRRDYQAGCATVSP